MKIEEYTATSELSKLDETVSRSNSYISVESNIVHASKPVLIHSRDKDPVGGIPCHKNNGNQGLKPMLLKANEDSPLVLLERACTFHEKGIELGINGAQLTEAMDALNTSQKILQKLVNTLALKSAKEDYTTRWQALHRMIRVCIHQAELNLILFQYSPVMASCEQALKHHEEMEQMLLMRTEQEPLQTNETGQKWNEKDELDVLKADVYRCLSIVDYRLGDDQHKVWDSRGTKLLENVLERDPNNERAKSLLALFWSYQITTGDVDSEKAVEDSIQAIDWLGHLYEKHTSQISSQEHEPSQMSRGDPSPREDGEVNTRRLSVVLRLASYAFRDVGRHEESMEAIRGALDVVRSLCRQRPCALIYLFELYHCQCALAEHMELMDPGGGPQDGGEELFVLEARKDAVSALSQLTDLLPNVPKYWRSLCTTLIDVADLQERNGEGFEALESSSRALEAASKCLACYSSDKASDIASIGEPSFEDRVEYARSLLERGRHLYIQNKHEEALPFYEDALALYTSYVLKQKRAQREDEFYLELILRSMQAASSCATMCANVNSDNAVTNSGISKAIWFLDQARVLTKERGGVKLRKNKVLSASLLLELSELYLMKAYNPSKAVGILQQDLLEDVIVPLHKEFPWHVAVGTIYGDAHLLLAKCYRATGEIKLEVQNCQEFLRHSSKKHGKDYSEWIGDDNTAAINEHEWGEEKLSQLRKVCDQEVPTVKKYRLPVRNPMGQVSWYSLEVGSAVPNKDPLEDQARVWKEDYGVEISEDIRESFRKLHSLALTNNVPMTELCDYALGSNSSQSSSGNNSNRSRQQNGHGTDRGPDNEAETNDDQNDDGTVSTSAESVSMASEQDMDENDGERRPATQSLFCEENDVHSSLEIDPSLNQGASSA